MVHGAAYTALLPGVRWKSATTRDFESCRMDIVAGNRGFLPPRNGYLPGECRGSCNAAIAKARRHAER